MLIIDDIGEAHEDNINVDIDEYYEYDTYFDEDDDGQKVLCVEVTRLQVGVYGNRFEIYPQDHPELDTLKQDILDAIKKAREES